MGSVMWVHSEDGTTPGAARSSLPTRFTKNADGEWSIPTADTAESFGWYPVTEVDRPDADPWDTATSTVVHDGSGFVQEWTVVRGTPPLIDPDDRIADDELHASVALLTEDSVGYRAIVGLLISKGLVAQAEAAAAIETATRRLVTLADHPDVRRQMIAERLARAEEVRESL